MTVSAAVVLLASGCSCSPAAPPLEGVDWRLQGSSASSTDFRAYGITARFENGTLAGRSSVNSYSAKYEVGGSSLEIGEVTMTLMAGTPEAMRAEELYVTLLRAVRSWRISNGQLELRDADGNALLIYTEQKKAAAPPPATAAIEETPSLEATSSPRGTALSEASTSYAASIGGTPHRGELLYLIVGGSFTTESAASTTLYQALSLFGDMQTYFVVQRSDNFAGLSPGQWIVIEAYRSSPDETSLGLARRAFPDARIQRGTVRTDDPIPVYEDLAGGP